MPTRRPKRPRVAKTAISLPPELLAHAQQMVRQGLAPSLSGYFAALTLRDRQRRDFARFVGDLERELGMTDADRARIDHELGFHKPARKAG